MHHVCCWQRSRASLLRSSGVPREVVEDGAAFSAPNKVCSAIYPALWLIHLKSAKLSSVFKALAAVALKALPISVVARI